MQTFKSHLINYTFQAFRYHIKKKNAWETLFQCVNWVLQGVTYKKSELKVATLLLIALLLRLVYNIFNFFSPHPTIQIHWAKHKKQENIPWNHARFWSVKAFFICCYGNFEGIPGIQSWSDDHFLFNLANLPKLLAIKQQKEKPHREKEKTFYGVLTFSWKLTFALPFMHVFDLRGKGWRKTSRILMPVTINVREKDWRKSNESDGRWWRKEGKKRDFKRFMPRLKRLNDSALCLFFIRAKRKR